MRAHIKNNSQLKRQLGRACIQLHFHPSIPAKKREKKKFIQVHPDFWSPRRINTSSAFIFLGLKNEHYFLRRNCNFCSDLLPTHSIQVCVKLQMKLQKCYRYIHFAVLICVSAWKCKCCDHWCLKKRKNWYDATNQTRLHFFAGTN